MRQARKWLFWVLINTGSYVIPLALAWLWLYQERNAAIESGNTLWASTDTPPMLAIMATITFWTGLLMVMNAAFGALWWIRARRAKSGHASAR